MRPLLAGFPHANTILEVGCGTGHFTRWFSQQGLRAIGLDLSPAMLAEARRLHSPSCVLGDALTLPFPCNSVDLVALITTLEFVGDPVQALREALRVARFGLILGVLNCHSLLAWEMKQTGEPLWQVARFFAPGELGQIVRRATGQELELVWRTTLWPFWPRDLPLPWGGFIGMAVKLNERRKEQTCSVSQHR